MEGKYTLNSTSTDIINCLFTTERYNNPRNLSKLFYPLPPICVTISLKIVNVIQHDLPLSLLLDIVTKYPGFFSEGTPNKDSFLVISHKNIFFNISNQYSLFNHKIISFQDSKQWHLWCGVLASGSPGVQEQFCHWGRPGHTHPPDSRWQRPRSSSLSCWETNQKQTQVHISDKDNFLNSP